MSLAAETPHHPYPVEPYPDESSFEAYSVFASLHREFYARLVRTCARHLRDQTMAEDIAQDTMLRAMRYWTCYDTERPSWPWLKGIALRLCADAHRARTREVCLGDLPERAESADRTEAVLDEITLRRALAGLPERQRLALRLRYIDDRDRVETAELLGLNVNAFDQLLSRARLRLAHVMEPARVGAPLGALLLPLRWLQRLLPKRARGGFASAAIGTAATLPLALTPLMVIVGGALSGPAVATPVPHTFTTGLAYVRPAAAASRSARPVTAVAPAAKAAATGPATHTVGVGPASAHATVAQDPFKHGTVEQHQIVIGPLTISGDTEHYPGGSKLCSLPVAECSH